MNRSGRTVRSSPALGSALLVSAALTVAAADPPDFKPTDFPPSQAVPGLTITVGDKVTIGGPKSANFLPNEWMDVYVVPHRVWREGDPLAANAVKRGRVKSDAKGGLPLTDLWKADKAGRFDIVVDYDGNGKFSYALDSLDGFVVRDKAEEKRPVLPDDKTIDTFRYTFSPKALGSSATLSVTRGGKVAYTYASAPHTGSGGKVVQEKWEIPEKDAAALLAGLVEDGLLDLEDSGGGKFPNHHVAVSYGRWQLSAHPKELPQKVLDRLLPLLRKAHPEEWKAAPDK